MRTNDILAVVGLSAAIALSSCGSDSSSDPGPSAPRQKVSESYSKSDRGVAWNESVTFATWKDQRDGQEYRTVQIGKQIWMAENLNYKTSGSDSSWCYGGGSDSCAKYGRLYTWLAAMQGAATTQAMPSGVQGICPEGWHLPSIVEWDTLVRFVERDPRVGMGKGGSALKARTGWSLTQDSNTVRGKDLFGFRALPAGSKLPNMYFYNGTEGGWWMSTHFDLDTTNGLKPFLGAGQAGVYSGAGAKIHGSSVRCVKN